MSNEISRQAKQINQDIETAIRRREAVLLKAMIRDIDQSVEYLQYLGEEPGHFTAGIEHAKRILNHNIKILELEPAKVDEDGK